MGRRIVHHQCQRRLAPLAPQGTEKTNEVFVSVSLRFALSDADAVLGRHGDDYRAEAHVQIWLVHGQVGVPGAPLPGQKGLLGEQRLVTVDDSARLLHLSLIHI